MDPHQFLQDRLIEAASLALPSPSPILTRIGVELFRNAAGRDATGRDAATEPPVGQAAKLGGEPVYYAGKNYDYQSPESYKKLFGAYPKGYTPPEKVQQSDDRDSNNGGDAGADTGAGTGARAPEGGPSLEGEGAKQEQEPITAEILERIDRYSDPAYQEELSRIKTRNLIEASTVLSALRAPRERQKQAAEIERRNIEAWQAIKTAQIEANARQQMALGLATVSAMTPNLSNFAEIYKASTAPFNIRPRG